MAVLRARQSGEIRAEGGGHDSLVTGSALKVRNNKNAQRSSLVRKRYDEGCARFSHMHWSAVRCADLGSAIADGVPAAVSEPKTNSTSFRRPMRQNLLADFRSLHPRRNRPFKFNDIYNPIVASVRTPALKGDEIVTRAPRGLLILTGSKEAI
jgi:hypothetical protein